VTHRRTEFEEFVAARSARLLRTAVLLTGDVHAAEDMLQTALWRTFRRWRTARDNPDAYVRTVLVNLAHDCRRNRSRRVAEAELAELSVPSPHDAVGRLVERDELIRALQQLPARQRTTVVLRFWDDSSVDETAALMQCSAGTVKSATSKALAQLRHLLDAGATGDELERNSDAH
jgi:RNA polymerase sigma-70 factor (sigma-E family)